MMKAQEVIDKEQAETRKLQLKLWGTEGNLDALKELLDKSKEELETIKKQKQVLSQDLEQIKQQLETIKEETQQMKIEHEREIEQMSNQVQLLQSSGEIEEKDELKIWIESDKKGEYIGYLKDDKMNVLLLHKSKRQCRFIFSPTKDSEVIYEYDFEKAVTDTFNIYENNEPLFRKKMAEACVNSKFPRYTKISHQYYMVNDELYCINKDTQQEEESLKQHNDYDLLSKHINMYRQLVKENIKPNTIRKINMKYNGFIHELTIGDKKYYGYNGEPTEKYETHQSNDLMTSIKEIMNNPDKKIEILNKYSHLFNVHSFLDLSRFIQCFEYNI